MQAARALELGRNQDAFRLLDGPAAAALADPAADSTFAAAVPPSRRTREAKTLSLYAKACLRTMRTARGVRAAARAVALEPRDPDAWIVKAHLDQRRFRNVAAVAAATEAVRLAPEDARVRAALGGFLLGGGMVGTPDFVRAEEELAAARKLDPEDRPAQFLHAKTLVLAGNAAGEAILDSLLAGGAAAPAEAHFLRGLARSRRGDNAGAADDFRRAGALEPWRAGAWFNWAKLLAREGRTADAEEAQRHFLLAQEIEDETRPVEIAFHASEENLAPGMELSGLFLRAGRAREAETILETLTMDHPETPLPAFLYSEAVLATGDAERAAEVATGALAVAPDHPRALVALSNAEARLGRADDALAHARRAVEGAPRMAAAHAALGRRMLEAGDAVGALRELQAARQLAPEDASILGAVGVALTKAEAWEDAEQALGAAITRGEPSAEWFLHRGITRAAMGRPAWAAKDFRYALALDPGESRAAAELARVLREMNRGAEADSAERAFAAISKKSQEAHTLRERWAKDPGNVDRALHLARVLETSGREIEAGRVLSQAFAVESAP